MKLWELRGSVLDWVLFLVLGVYLEVIEQIRHHLGVSVLLKFAPCLVYTCMSRGCMVMFFYQIYHAKHEQCHPTKTWNCSFIHYGPTNLQISYWRCSLHQWRVQSTDLQFLVPMVSKLDAKVGLQQMEWYLFMPWQPLGEVGDGDRWWEMGVCACNFGYLFYTLLVCYVFSVQLNMVELIC